MLKALVLLFDLQKKPARLNYVVQKKPKKHWFKFKLPAGVPDKCFVILFLF